MVFLLLGFSIGGVGGNGFSGYFRSTLAQHDDSDLLEEQDLAGGVALAPVPTRAFTRHQSIATIAALIFGTPSVDLHIDAIVRESQASRAPSSAVRITKHNSKKMRKAVDRTIRKLQRTRRKTSDMRFRKASRGRRTLERENTNFLLRGANNNTGTVSSQRNKLRGQTTQQRAAEIGNPIPQNVGLFDGETAHAREQAELGRKGGFLGKTKNSPNTAVAFGAGIAIGGAAGTVVGAGGLAVILCIQGTICNTPTPAPTAVASVFNSGEMAITISGSLVEPSQADIDEALEQIRLFYTDVLGSDFSGSFISFTPTESGTTNVASGTDLISTIAFTAESIFSDTATAIAASEHLQRRLESTTTSEMTAQIEFGQGRLGRFGSQQRVKGANNKDNPGFNREQPVQADEVAVKASDKGSATSAGISDAEVEEEDNTSRKAATNGAAANGNNKNGKGAETGQDASEQEDNNKVGKGADMGREASVDGDNQGKGERNEKIGQSKEADDGNSPNNSGDEVVQDYTYNKKSGKGAGDTQDNDGDNNNNNSSSSSSSSNGARENGLDESGVATTAQFGEVTVVGWDNSGNSNSNGNGGNEVAHDSSNILAGAAGGSQHESGVANTAQFGEVTVVGWDGNGNGNSGNEVGQDDSNTMGYADFAPQVESGEDNSKIQFGKVTVVGWGSTIGNSGDDKGDGSARDESAAGEDNTAQFGKITVFGWGKGGSDDAKTGKSGDENKGREAGQGKPAKEENSKLGKEADVGQHDFGNNTYQLDAVADTTVGMEYRDEYNGTSGEGAEASQEGSGTKGAGTAGANDENEIGTDMGRDEQWNTGTDGGGVGTGSGSHISKEGFGLGGLGRAAPSRALVDASMSNADTQVFIDSFLVPGVSPTNHFSCSNHRDRAAVSIIQAKLLKFGSVIIIHSFQQPLSFWSSIHVKCPDPRSRWVKRSISVFGSLPISFKCSILVKFPDPRSCWVKRSISVFGSLPISFKSSILVKWPNLKSRTIKFSITLFGSLINTFKESIFNTIKNSLSKSIINTFKNSIFNTINPSIIPTINYAIRKSIFITFKQSFNPTIKHAFKESIFPTIKHSIAASISSAIRNSKCEPPALSFL
ncbi:expressed unknown protein [Seminavis robusta]|uniref:Uncharacterized protein n=1 Tax=Seminavis robusta TaxID=568900 RepID=A0A9N8E1E4_9STRA|nr:expressed unknown protein [Seminavis robusta]|eukprot:Sro554_g165460.1 n/a (1106) ;mRNA; r:9159-12573